MPETQPNPDGTTTVDDVIVTGQRRTVRTVYPPSVVPPSPPLAPENDELPDNDPGEPMQPPTECEKEVTRDRAALEAAELIGGFPDNLEHGFFLVEDSDGSIRAVGPVEGYLDPVTGQPSIDWDVTLAELGITSWSQLVGLVHSHPRILGQGGIDRERDEFSGEDVDVNNAFLAAGVDPDKFRQYIVIDNDMHQFGSDAEEGDEATNTNKVSGVNNCV